MNVKAPSTSSPLRWIPVTGLMLLLILWSWATNVGWVGYRGIRDAEVGTHHVLSLFTVTEVGEGRYRLARGSLYFDVVGNTYGLTLGQEVSVGIKVDPPHVFVEDSTVRASERPGAERSEAEEAESRPVLVEEWRVPAPGRGDKKRLGYIGLGLATAIGLATLRVGRKGVSIRG